MLISVGILRYFTVEGYLMLFRISRLLLLTCTSIISFPALTDSVNTPLKIIINKGMAGEDLQDQNSTINFLTAEELDAFGVDSTDELQYKVPGLVLKSSGGVGSVYLRGVGGTVSNSSDSGVATFIDDVYLTSGVQSLQDLYDLDRVEVIKGPHATKFGRNLIGGAVSLITRDPQFYNETYVDMLYGDYNQSQLRAAFNRPINNNLSFRLAGTIKKRDGYSKNIFFNKDLDDEDYYSFRGKLRYLASNELDVIISAEQNKRNDTKGLVYQPAPDLGINAAILLGGVVPDDPRKVMHNIDQYQDTKSDLYSVKVTSEAGTLKVRFITAYQGMSLDVMEDLDATDIDFASLNRTINTQAVSQEVRVETMHDQPISWVAGIFLLQEDINNKSKVLLPLMSVENIPDSKNKKLSYSAFAETSYLFATGWRASAGLRYSYEESKLDLEQTIIDPLGVLGAAGTSINNYIYSKNWDAFTPELGVTYSKNKNVVYYMNAARGFKPGGFNAYTSQPSYEEEYLWAYEAGIKATFPEQKISINAALFNYKYTDIQLLTFVPDAPPGTLPVITNAAKATIRGLDFQFSYQPLPRLKLNLAATLMDARYDEYSSIDPNNLTDDPDRSGDQLPHAPDLSFSLSGEYRWKLFDEAELRFSLGYRYQSEVYFNPYNDPAVRQEAFSLLNSSLRYENSKNYWYAEFYINNVTNELYAQNIIRLDPVVGTKRIWGEPRNFGLRIGYRL